tara:strand:- start:72 stop:281 length:210 start_codon:yes stop_codon:yes gene_type:complete
MKEDKTFVNKDGYAKSVDVNVADQSIEIDPRSKTTADKAFNYIGTGKPEMEVKGQGAVMADKRRKSKAF